MAQEYKSARLVIAPSGTATVVFQTGTNFKDLACSVSSEGRTVTNCTYHLYEGGTTLVTGSWMAVTADGVIYADDHTRGPNQPASNWALQQQGMAIPNVPITLSITNNDTNPVVLVGSIQAYTYLFQ